MAEIKKTEKIKKDDIIYYIKNCLKKDPKQMLELLVDKIILYDDKIDIYYKFDKRSPDGNDQDFVFYTEEMDALIFLNQYCKSIENKFIIQLYCSISEFKAFEKNKKR